MIDMALLKQAMEQMDAEDPEAAQAAKERAAQTLSNANLSFSTIAELIEQRRLLLRPRIVSGIRRMDQPGMLGDAAFRDAGSALRREGQSFRQIAEAIELSSPAAPRYEDHPVQTSAPAYQPAYQMPIEPFDAAARQPGEPAWTRWLVLAASYVFYPLRHPIQFLALALAVYLLFSALLGPGSGPGSPGGFAAVRQSADKALSSVSSFINEQILRKPKEVAAMPAKPAPTPAPLAASPSPSPTPSPSPPSATPSAAPAAASPPRTISPAPSANVSASPVPPSAAPSTPVDPWVAPALPPVQTPRREAKAAPPSRSATNCIPGRDNRYPGSCAPYEDSRSRAFDEIIPEVIRRKSRVAGPCVGGIGGCYWGGFHY